MDRKTGTYQELAGHKHFIPNPLPPLEPPLLLSKNLIDLYGKAMHNLGKLNEMFNRIPEIDINRFINAYVIKEALLSSEIARK